MHYLGMNEKISELHLAKFIHLLRPNFGSDEIVFILDTLRTSDLIEKR